MTNEALKLAEEVKIASAASRNAACGLHDVQGSIDKVNELIDRLAALAQLDRGESVARNRRYQFLIGFLIERGVLTEKRYRNGTWSLQGIALVDDSGLRGAGRTPEEALDNAIVASSLDPEAAANFWRATNEALAFTAPVPVAVAPQVLAKYDCVLMPFLDMMRAELHANGGKGDRPGWLSMSREAAMLEIYHHAAKLAKAMRNGDASLIREHAADVANMSMMAVDICGLLAASPQEQQS